VESRREIVANECVVVNVTAYRFDIRAGFSRDENGAWITCRLSVLPVLFPDCLKSEAEAF
jgi:hypothetical protein